MKACAKRLVCGAAIALSIVAAGQKKPVTLDFVNNEADKIYSPVWYFWEGKHDLLIAGPSGGYQILDPETDKRHAFGDAAKQTKALGMAGASIQDGLSAPDAVSPDGRWLAFIFDKDLFVLEPDSNSAFKVSRAKSEVQNLQFSPDSKSLGFAQDHDLYTVSLGSHKITRLTSDGKGNLLNGVLTWMYWEEIYNHHDRAFWWSPDSKHIAYLRADESNVAPSYIVDFRPQYPALHSQCYPKPGNANPKVDLRIIPASGGSPVSLDPLKKEDGYIVGVKWATASHTPILLYQLLNRAQTKATICKASPAGASQVIQTETDRVPMDVNNDFNDLDDNGTMLYGCDLDGHEVLERVWSQGASFSLVPVTSSKWQVLPAEVFDPTTVAYIDRTAKQIYFTCDKDSFLQRQLYRTGFDGSGLTRITKGDGTHSCSFSPDGRYYIDDFSNTNTPPAKNLCRSDGSLVEPLAQANQELANSVELSPETYIEIPARDGFKLPATIRKPRNMEPGRLYPAIIKVYGGPEAPTVSDEWNFEWAEDQLMAENGFIVLHADNRSSTVINKNNTDAVFGHYYGDSERNDFVDAAEWLKKQPDVDPGRIGIRGWSGGGGNTLNCMCRSTEFKAGMAGAPYVDPAFYDSFYSEHLFGLPKDNPQGYAAARLWQHAKDLHGILLMMFGTGDDNVHNQHEQTFINSLVAAGKTVQVMIFPMRKHGLGDPAANAVRLKTELEFFKANL